MLTQFEKLLTIADVAEICGVSVHTISRWTASGEIVPPIRLGRRLLRWRADDFQSWLDSKNKGDNNAN